MTETNPVINTERYHMFRATATGVVGPVSTTFWDTKHFFRPLAGCVKAQCIMRVHTCTRDIFLWSHAFSSSASAEHEEALWQQVIQLLLLFSKIASETISEGPKSLNFQVACPNPQPPLAPVGNVQNAQYSGSGRTLHKGGWGLTLHKAGWD